MKKVKGGVDNLENPEWNFLTQKNSIFDKVVVSPSPLFFLFGVLFYTHWCCNSLG